jgi:protein TonB
MRPEDYIEDDDPGFFRRYRIVIGAIVFLLVASLVGGVIFIAVSFQHVKPKKPEEIMVHLEMPKLPPPPPPPPPPKTPPPEQPKMVEQPKVNKPEQKPDPAKPDKPPSAPGPVASGPPSDFGLGGGGGGDGIGGGGGGGSKYGWYAGEVQAAVKRALDNNDKTKNARAHVKVRIWADSNGRVTRASLAGSSGDASIDNAIKNEVLTGLQLPEPPPSDMPMPIVMMISEQRPN